MSTRSITHLYDDRSPTPKIVCSFYRHHDGYPDGHGAELKQWLQGKKVVNGIGQDFVKGRDYNGMGSLAVSMMTHFDREASIRTIPTGDHNYGEEYTYHVSYSDGKFFVSTEENYNSHI